LRGYETVLIGHPDAGEEELDALTRRLREVVEKGGGRIVRVERWGKKRLGYKIGKSSKGAYVVVSFVADHGILPEVDRILRYHDQVLRHQTTKVEMVEEAPQEEEVASTEGSDSDAPGMQGHAAKTSE
jgi:small subunit ribosomal protein S6